MKNKWCACRRHRANDRTGDGNVKNALVLSSFWDVIHLEWIRLVAVPFWFFLVLDGKPIRVQCDHKVMKMISWRASHDNRTIMHTFRTVYCLVALLISPLASFRLIFQFLFFVSSIYSFYDVLQNVRNVNVCIRVARYATCTSENWIVSMEFSERMPPTYTYTHVLCTMHGVQFESHANNCAH